MGNPYGQSGRWLSSIADATAYAQHARKNFCNLEYRIVRLSKDADVSTGLFARVSRVIRQWKSYRPLTGPQASALKKS
jgi:hypothetical protein